MAPKRDTKKRGDQVLTVREHMTQSIANDSVLGGESVTFPFKFAGFTQNISVCIPMAGLANRSPCVTNCARRTIEVDEPILGPRKASFILTAENTKLTADRAIACIAQLFQHISPTGVTSITEDESQWVVSADIKSPLELKEYIEKVAHSNVPLVAKLGTAFVTIRPLAPNKGHYPNTIRVWPVAIFSLGDVDNAKAMAFDIANIEKLTLPILKGENKLYTPPTASYNKSAGGELRKSSWDRPGF